MQHAEKGKKILKLKSFQISPHKLKRTQVPQRRSSTYKLKRGLNYTENREPELHLTNTYIQKKGKKNHQNFPFKLSTVCGSLRQDQICNLYWNRSISLTRVKYKKLRVVQFIWITSHNVYIYQSLATSILYTIKFLNILTSPSMCKQEDYFKKIDLHAQQKLYFHVMQAQGGPSRAELWD